MIIKVPIFPDYEHILRVCPNVCMSITYMPGAQKRVSDPLELALQEVVYLHVGTGNQSQVLWKNS